MIADILYVICYHRITFLLRDDHLHITLHDTTLWTSSVLPYDVTYCNDASTVHTLHCTTLQDKDFYIMELDNGLYVDGKHKGSNSRFINHSCDPNCELQRWVVKGE